MGSFTLKLVKNKYLKKWRTIRNLASNFAISIPFQFPKTSPLTYKFHCKITVKYPYQHRIDSSELKLILNPPDLPNLFCISHEVWLCLTAPEKSIFNTLSAFPSICKTYLLCLSATNVGPWLHMKINTKIMLAHRSHSRTS